MTDKELYNTIMNSAKYRNMLETHNYKALYLELCFENRQVSPEDLTRFLGNAGIKLVRDGIIPAQIYRNASMTSYNFSDIKKIGTGAFMGSALESADLRKVEEIQPFAFMNSKISEVILPKTGKIGNSAFGHCMNLEEVYIPAEVQLGNGVFEACSHLDEVFIEEGRTEFPPTFNGVDMVSIVYIPKNIQALEMFTHIIVYTTDTKWDERQRRWVELGRSRKVVNNRDAYNNRYDYRNGRKNLSKVKINKLFILGPEDEQFLESLKTIINDVESNISVNEIAFTG